MPSRRRGYGVCEEHRGLIFAGATRDSGSFDRREDRPIFRMALIMAKAAQ